MTPTQEIQSIKNMKYFNHGCINNRRDERFLTHRRAIDGAFERT